MSLAEELLADLEEIGDAAPVKEEPTAGDEAPATQESVRSVARLLDSGHLASVLQQIDQFDSGPPRQASEIQGPVEADPEYQLIVEANNLAVQIDNELHLVHRYCRDKYSARFPELETLVPAPLDYLQTVRALANEPLENSKNQDSLRPFLTPATIMVVSVTASTTQGGPLSDTELQWVLEACAMALELHSCRQQVLRYVESRMQLIAPNLSAIVGASVAAKLLGAAGGLSALIRMPSCNIQVLGSMKKQLSGFSSATQGLHRGFLYECDCVQSLPPDLRPKAVRLAGAKCTLAARVDNFHESPDGGRGRDLMQELQRKLDKLTEPPPAKQVKALAAPIDPPSKKRGGRRHRKMKERLGMTEMRRAANRVNFGEVQDDAYQADLGFSLGTLGRASSGRIRAPVADAKTKARVSKALAQKLQRMQQQQQHGGATSLRRHISGTASSFAFTPVQGLEIINPKASEKSAEEEAANAKYFGTKSSFFHVGTDLLSGKGKQ